MKNRLKPTIPAMIMCGVLPVILFSTYAASAQGQSYHSFFEDIYGSAEDEYQDILVERVEDTATIRLSNGERVRMIGLKALDVPSRYASRSEDEALGTRRRSPDIEMSLEESGLLYVTELLENQRIRLVFDVDRAVEANRRQYTLAYVFLVENGTFVNAEILRQGYAHLQLRPPNIQYAQELRAGYNQGRESLKGLHAR